MKFKKVPIICGGFAAKRSLRRVGSPEGVGEDGRGAVARVEQRGAFRACGFYEKFARHRMMHGTPLQREPRRRVSAAPEQGHIARPLAACSRDNPARQR